MNYAIKHSGHFGGKKAQHFPYQCLLPVLNVLAYYDPLAWHKAKAGASYTAEYELASHSRLFVELLDEAIEET